MYILKCHADDWIVHRRLTTVFDFNAGFGAILDQIGYFAARVPDTNSNYTTPFLSVAVERKLISVNRRTLSRNRPKILLNHVIRITAGAKGSMVDPMNAVAVLNDVCHVV